MFRLLCALCFLAFLPNAANATSTASIISTSCSGSLSTSLLDGASFACAGNLTLDGGFITSDSLINISADGTLFLDNITFTAPNVTLSALTGVIVGNNTIISGDFVAINVSGSSAPAVIVQGNRESILSWPKFNIGQSAVVNFNQLSSSSAVLNRVIGATDIPTGNVNLVSGITASKGANLGGVVDVITRPSGSLSLSNGNGIIPRTDFPVVGGTLTVQPSAQFISVVAADGFDAPLVLSAVPEPSTYTMMLAGILGLISFRRKVY